MARKRLKRKRRSRKLCHPNKRAQSNRLSPREQVLLRRVEEMLSGRADWGDA